MDRFLDVLRGFRGSSGAALDLNHRRQSKTRGIFRSIWPENDGPLPWRLTNTVIDMLDKRMSRVLWPHYMERLYCRGASFWKFLVDCGSCDARFVLINPDCLFVNKVITHYYTI